MRNVRRNAAPSANDALSGSGTSERLSARRRARRSARAGETPSPASRPRARPRAPRRDAGNSGICGYGRAGSGRRAKLIAAARTRTSACAVRGLGIGDLGGARTAVDRRENGRFQSSARSRREHARAARSCGTCRRSSSGSRRRTRSARAATTSRTSARGTRAARRPSPSRPPCSTTAASGRSAHFSSGTAITAASATAGCAMSAFSSSTDEIHSPPDLITSFERSLIWMNPRGWIETMSPVGTSRPRSSGRRSRARRR